MSLKDQIAMGKNTQLQKRLDDTHVNFKRALRQSRRRLDLMEEECVASLYRMMVDAREHQAAQAPPSTGEPSNTTNGRAESARMFQHPVNRSKQASEENREKPKRPASTMSLGNFVQSYSFMKDGMNISRNRKDRYVKIKQHKAERDQHVVIARRHVERPSTTADRPQTSVSRYTTKDHHEGTKQRPMTCQPTSRGVDNTLANRIKQFNINSSNKHVDENMTADQHEDPDRDDSTTGNSKMDLADDSDQSKSDTHSNEHHINPDEEHAIKFHIGQVSTKPGNSLDDSPDNTEKQNSTQSTCDVSNDDVAVPLNIEEENLTKITTCTMRTSINDKNSCGKFRSKSAVIKSPSERMLPLRSSKSRLSTYKVIESDTDKTLQESTTKTHNFLTEYAKKSKLFGYVVNATASSTAPRDKSRKMYRSPCVTYQELVSIKANIKQHKTQTRMLLQRSEQIRNYVCRLSNASAYREFKASGQ